MPVIHNNNSLWHEHFAALNIRFSDQLDPQDWSEIYSTENWWLLAKHKYENIIPDFIQIWDVYHTPISPIRRQNMSP